MSKKIILGLLIAVFIALLVGRSDPGITTMGENYIYKSFLGNIFAKLLEPDGEVYAGWVNGLKKDKNFTVKRIITDIEILQVEEKDGDALVGFKLTLKCYCLTLSGAKVTYISSKLAISIMKANPTKPDDLKKFKAGPENTNIIDGWNGELDT